MKNSILIAFMLLFTVSIFAQDNVEADQYYDYKIMIGSSAGFTSGTGLSFRYVKEESGLTLTFLPYYFRDSDSSEAEKALNVGLSYNYYIRANDYVDFSLKVSGQTQHGSFINPFGNRPQDFRLNFGIGPEINFHLIPEIDIDLHFGYGIYDVMNSLNSSLTASVGFYYNLYL